MAQNPQQQSPQQQNPQQQNPIRKVWRPLHQPKNWDPNLTPDLHCFQTADPATNFSQDILRYGRPFPGRVDGIMEQPPQYPGTKLKSGLTPLPSPGLIPDLPWRVSYQRDLLRGFTMRELVDFGIIYKSWPPEQELDNNIHPLFARDRWDLPNLIGIDTQPAWLPPSFGGGPWDTNNQIVWDTILPLATQLLSHVEVHPWYDALLLGQRQPLDVNRLSAEYQLNFSDKIPNLKTFHLRTPGPDNAREAAAEKAALLTSPMFKNLWLTISNGRRKRNANWVMDWADPTEGHTFGTTRPASARLPDGSDSGLLNCLVITLDYSMFEILLRDDLTIAERNSGVFFAAQTLFHEMMHATGHAVYMRDNPTHKPNTIGLGIYEEPFFEDEPIPELGASGVAALFDGTPEPLVPVDFWTHVGLAVTLFPSWVYPIRDLLLASPVLDRHTYMIPLTADYIGKVTSKGFWDTTTNYLRDLKPRPIQTAMRLDRDTNQDEIIPFNLLYQSIPLESGQNAKITRLLGLKPAARTKGGADVLKARIEAYRNTHDDYIAQKDKISNLVEIVEIRHADPAVFNASPNMGKLLPLLDKMIQHQKRRADIIDELDRLQEGTKELKEAAYDGLIEWRRLLLRLEFNKATAQGHADRINIQRIDLDNIRKRITASGEINKHTTLDVQRDVDDANAAEDDIAQKLPQKARGDAAARLACGQDAESLLKWPGTSTFYRMVARLMIAWMEIDKYDLVNTALPADYIDSWLAHTDRCQTTMGRLGPHAGANAILAADVDRMAIQIKTKLSAAQRRIVASENPSCTNRQLPPLPPPSKHKSYGPWDPRMSKRRAP